MKNLGSSRALRLAREGGWIVLGQVAAAFGMLVLVRFLTEYLDPDQYGKLALALTLGTLVGQVAMSGVMPGIMRFFTISSERNDLPSYLAASIRLMGYGTLASLILGAIVLVGTALVGYSQWIVVIAAAIAFTQLSSYNTTLSSIQNAARQRSVVALHSALDPWVKILFAATILHLFGSSSAAVIISYALATLLILCSQLLFVRRLIPHDAGRYTGGQSLLLRKMWSYSQPFVIFNMFTWAQASSDRWALQSFGNTHDVGLYAVLMQLGFTPIAMIVGLLTTFVGPILNQRSGDATDHSRNANVHRISWQLTLLCLVITLVAFLLALGLHGWIFELLVAPDYRSVSYMLPWLLLAGGLFAAGQVLTMKLMSDMNTAALLWPKLGTALVGVCLNYAGAYYAGLPGIVTASILFALLQLIWLAILTVDRPKISVDDPSLNA